jgi:hypothetical protein
MLFCVANVVYCNPEPVRIGSKFLPSHAAHNVDGVYWERLPALSESEEILQKGLLRKTIVPRIAYEIEVLAFFK